MSRGAQVLASKSSGADDAPVPLTEVPADSFGQSPNVDGAADGADAADEPRPLFSDEDESDGERM